MKKKFFTLAVLGAMIIAPLSANASSNINPMLSAEPGYEMQSYEHHGSRGASPEQVEAVIELIKSTSFDDSKMKVAKVCLQLRDMDVSAIRRITECFSFSDKKKEILKYAINHCSNVREYYRLSDVLTFSSDKDDFNKFVNEYLDSYRY